MQSLADEGFLERRQGQGTFLRQGKYARRVSSGLDFLAHGKRTGVRTSTKLVSLEVRERSIAESTLFDARDRSLAIEIKRLRLMDGEVCVFQTSVLPVVELADYPASDLEARSLYRILEQDFRIVVGPVKETLSCCNASAEVASVLDVSPGDAVFVSHRVVRSKSNQVIEVSRNFIRSDRYCFVQDSAITEVSE